MRVSARACVYSCARIRVRVFARAAAGVLTDLFAFDPVALAWTDLSESAAGAGPTPRARAGLAAAGGRLFVFGGYQREWFLGAATPAPACVRECVCACVYACVRARVRACVRACGVSVCVSACVGGGGAGRINR